MRALNADDNRFISSLRGVEGGRENPRSPNNIVHVVEASFSRFLASLAKGA